MSAAGREFRWLPSRDDRPARNLAVDEALLAGPKEALRFYGWSPPGLSLGYFQSVRREWLEEAARRGFEVVRRPTGGGAIAHVEELTFAITDRVGAGIFGVDTRGDILRLHTALARGLARLGVRCRLRGSASLRSDDPANRWLCFSHSSDLDLVADDRKLLGSAARRGRGKVLVHGSLPLGHNPWTPEAASLQSCLGSRPVAAEVAATLAEELAGEYGLRLRHEELDPGESERADALLAERYGVAEWTSRR